ncbi:MAG: insulinase family protein [Deltaproteobacteria bacterium HGW-Deltaproteobacteria-12]|jgi:predicted Zn-dependent peptidase|nr:MAG: insulinase family protein [Deltaproteobacteria bacterium HGW-Deltaproteobacteria-12]
MIKIHKFQIIFFVLLIFFFVAGPSYGFDLEKRVIKTKLKNGLTVLMLERHVSPTVSLYIRYRVGAADETEGETGAAHFLEHMMFKGTKTIGTKNYPREKKILVEIEKTGDALDKEKSRGQNADQQKIQALKATLSKLQAQHKKYFIPNEIDRLYTENGGLDMNASTGQDVTTYQVSLPANKIELWARIESDRLRNPVFREFYTERDVIMEERRQRVETDPHGKLYEQFLSTAFKIHPYGRPIIGRPADMINLKPASIKNMFQKYQAPDSIVIAVVGDIKPDNTLKLIEKYFGGIPPSQKIPAGIPAEPAQTEERRVVVNFDANPQLLIGYHKPTAPAYEDYVLDVLETILTKGRTSRLYNLLVTELGVAKSISAYNGTPGTRYPNLFMISAEPRFPHTNSQLEKIILREIDKIKSQPISTAELHKAKKHLRMGYIKSLDSNSQLASTLSYYEVLLGDYRYFANYLNTIEKVSPGDIQNAVKRYFSKENRTIAELNKKKD